MLMWQLLRGTPAYVWILLGYIMIIGVTSCYSRIVYLPKLFLIPALLIGLKWKTFLSGDVVWWAGGFMAGMMIGFIMHNRQNIRVLNNRLEIEVPGGYSTLIILISFFIIKYCFGYLNAVHSQYAIIYSWVDALLGGAFSGYFIGRAMSYVNKYYAE